jgi:signal transduction histidine kinase
VLAVLGYFSLRQWQQSAELLFREQAREVAAMAAEKVEMTVLKAEEECLGALQLLVLEPGFEPAMVDGWTAKAPFVARVYLLQRDGRLLHPAGDGVEPATLDAVRAEIPQSFWDRGGRRHLMTGGEVVLAAILRSVQYGPLLAVLTRNEDTLRREVLEKTLAGVEGPSLLAVLDGAGRPVYAPRSLDRAAPVLTVDLGEALPTWRVALYQPEGNTPQGTVARQAMLFTAALACLLVVIVLGLIATDRLVRHESEMARLKSDFVANVSHDLKTPLSLIRMFAETLEMGRVREEGARREYYSVITREAERLTRLIDNVLDFSRIEGGRRRYDLQVAPVEPLIHEVLDSFRYVLAGQGFKLETRIDPGLPEIRMDPHAIGQALANLIDNAIKYSEARRVVRVAARRQGDEVVIEVGDEGIGVAPADLHRIFDKFYRVGHSETQGRRGSGLGLTLVKHIVEAHSGHVSVESRPGEGSRFVLHLPASGVS